MIDCPSRVVASAVLGLTLSIAASAAQNLEALLSLTGRHVERLSDELKVVIGDERSVQRQVSRRGSVQISIESEILFMWLPEREQWLAVRNVRSVDGRPIPDSKERIDRALAGPTEGTVSRLRLLQSESSRFDLGSVARSVGYPTVVLKFLLPNHQPRFQFTDDGTDRMGGIHVRKLNFVERTRPTEVELNGRDSLAKGTIWARPSDGVVVRTNMRLSDFTHEVSVDVTFRQDDRLALWVPSQMNERYRTNLGEEITSRATYSNFRRFETSGRIVK